MLLWIWLLIILAAIVVITFISYYNRFAVLGNRIDNSLAQIDVQLRKRADLVPNLISSVKGYMKHEKSILVEVTKARTSFLNAQSPEAKFKAGNQMQQALKSIFAVAENYPQIKASENFLQLQNELSAIEDKVAYSRQYYNDSILSYDNKRKTFPGNLFFNLFGFKAKPYLEIPAEARAVPKVEF